MSKYFSSSRQLFSFNNAQQRAAYLMRFRNLYNLSPTKKDCTRRSRVARPDTVARNVSTTYTVESLPRPSPGESHNSFIYATTPIAHRRDVAQSHLFLDPEINPGPRFVITQSPRALITNRCYIYVCTYTGSGRRGN